MFFRMYLNSENVPNFMNVRKWNFQIWANKI